VPYGAFLASEQLLPLYLSITTSHLLIRMLQIFIILFGIRYDNSQSVTIGTIQASLSTVEPTVLTFRVHISFFPPRCITNEAPIASHYVCIYDNYDRLAPQGREYDQSFMKSLFGLKELPVMERDTGAHTPNMDQSGSLDLDELLRACLYSDRSRSSAHVSTYYNEHFWTYNGAIHPRFMVSVDSCDAWMQLTMHVGTN
jgi:hypothetical protein